MTRSLAKGGLLQVDRAGNGTANITGNANVFAQILKNPVTGAGFYVVKHANTTLQTTETFSLNLNTSIGPLTVPQYGQKSIINGRQAKVLVSDFDAAGQRIIYSTAEILAASVVDQNSVIVLWLPSGESGEFALQGAGRAAVVTGNSRNVNFHTTSSGTVVSYTQGQGMSVVLFDNGVRAVLLDRATAYTVWQPALDAQPNVELNDTLLVLGPHLVRSAAVGNDGTLVITGDYSNTTQLEIFTDSAPGCAQWNPHGGFRGGNGWSNGGWSNGKLPAVTFNGKAVRVSLSNYGTLVGTLEASHVSVSSVQASIPALSSWKVADSLPERFANYSDTGKAWVAASDTSTPNPSPPATYPVLYADQYGFHQQNILWRGHFSGGNASGVFLNVIGGTSSGWSAWLNGVYLGSTLGDTTLPATNMSINFPIGAAKSGDNVLLVLQDNMGHDETEGVLNPRGILNATLLSRNSSTAAKFTSWKVAGNAGGEANIDPVRGPLNEGGLYAERLGWHLPGFDDSAWPSSSPDAGFSEAGVKFYRTILPLNMPEGYDASLAFELNAPSNSSLRAQLYVNGYNFGMFFPVMVASGEANTIVTAKFIPHIGHQVEFPVYPGILDYHGDNTIGLTVWAQSAQGASMNVAVKVLTVLQSSLDPASNSSALRPGWTSQRLQYA